MKTQYAWAVLFVLLATPLLTGDEPERPNEKERAAHLARMKELAASIRLLANPRQMDSAVKLLEKPILRYADDTRQTQESSLWIWSNGGRPTALVAIEFYPKPPLGPKWLYEIASLSTARIAAERGGDLRWTAKEPGLKFTRLDDAEPVADKATRRLAQMKDLRERFTAYEKATIEGRIELRPLTAPLFRYESNEQDVVDGAIFAFCNGTNPEVLLVLEAQKMKDKPAAWHFALVQTTGEFVSAQLDEKPVWERGLAEPPAVRDSYVNGWLAVEKGE